MQIQIANFSKGFLNSLNYTMFRKYLYPDQTSVIRLDQILFPPSIRSTREPSDLIKSITWPLAAQPGSSLIGSKQSRDLLPLDQGASWLDQFNHVTSCHMTRELAEWIKSITWPLATWTGSSLIGSNQSRDLLPLNQGASWLDQFNHLACFLRGLFQNLWKSTRCKKILQTFVLFQYIVGGKC